MTSHGQKYASVAPLCSVLLSLACSGSIEDPPVDGAGTTPGAAGDEAMADENGVILGVSWQALSYPTCASSASDRNGDGFGIENGRSCVVAKPPASITGTSTTGTSTTGTSTTGTSTVCANLEGAASTMAAIAVSVAMEMGRWQPSIDLTIGTQGSDEVLIITAEGKSRCGDGVCYNTQALLDFQKDEASGKVNFPGNVSLNSSALRSRLVAKFREQVSCEQQPSNGGSTNCPAEEHTLTFQRSEKGGCDTNFFFVARKPNGGALAYPAQLKNKLLWADRTNPYIGFQSVGEVVSIDPTFGLNDRGSTTTGACTAACVKISPVDLAGGCCSCRGVSKSLVRSSWSTATFLCQ